MFRQQFIIHLAASESSWTKRSFSHLTLSAPVRPARRVALTAKREHRGGGSSILSCVGSSSAGAAGRRLNSLWSRSRISPRRDSLLFS
eukprot:scaffold878_cov271-Pinguiococcus_pyrenoidosus.AAC.8